MEATDLDVEALRETFLAETDEQLAAMEEALLALEDRPADAEALQTIFRAAHTLKGNAASMGSCSVAELAHALEDLLDRLRRGELAASGGVVTLLLRTVDAIRREVHEDGAASSATAASGQRTLRVDLARLDRMLDLSGEIAVAHGRLSRMLHAAGETSGAALVEAHCDADRIFLDLQEEILRARMVPLGPTFRQQLRTVRDAAHATGKLARLVIEGEDVEVDTALVEQIRGPITHMVRNALDHGIETPETRAARGKDPRGRITLRARHESGGVAIEVGDDGAGLDRERIAAKAVEKRLLARADAATEEDLFRLVFEPGFSTSDAVTELSGRGVGMDVVRRNVEALRGSVGVASRPGAGTTFTIRVPLTVAIIPGFLVASGGETYVIPLGAVLECVDLPDVSRDAEAQVVDLRGEPVPYLRLRDAFALPGPVPARESLVVVSCEGRRAALAVDSLLGDRQVVVKSCARALGNVPGVAGSTILDTGRVALILDVTALVQSAKQVFREGDRRTQC